MNETNELWRLASYEQRQFRDHEEADQLARLNDLRDRSLIEFECFNRYHYRIWTAERPDDTVDFWPRTSVVRHHNRTISGGWIVLMRILGIPTKEWMA